MKNKKSGLVRAHCVFALLAFYAGIISAEPLRQETFEKALTEAKQIDMPVAVYVHGSSWQAASRIFDEKIWSNPDLADNLKNAVIFTSVHVGQLLDEAAGKAEAERNKGWKGGTVSSFPAIQIYAPDGHLLKTFQGREFRAFTSVEVLALAMDQVTSASAERSSFLAEIARAREAKDSAAETAALASLAKLSVNAESNLVEQLKSADPEDTSGWQARLTFGNWSFIREINGLINAEKAEEALARVDSMIAAPHYTPAQRIYLHGARGNTLVALGRLSDAWAAFRQAFDSAPEDPNALAMLHHGQRVAGFPSRTAFPEDSILNGKDIGDLISADATFSMSSADHDEPANHPSLFKGAHAAYAFHTGNEKGAHIIIDLAAVCAVKALRITNRPDAAERAASLTLWYSGDGMTWTKGWQSESVESAWDILFETPVKMRYLKIGLDPEVANFLHLRAVDVYGERE